MGYANFIAHFYSDGQEEQWLNFPTLMKKARPGWLM
jgi:hypothetical protein